MHQGNRMRKKKALMQTQAATVHVVLADDHHLVRSGIRSLLEAIPGVDVIAEVADGAELLELLDSLNPDLVITDLEMPGVDGLTALAIIRRKHPGVRVMVLSMHDSPDMVKRAVAYGVRGYVRKDASCLELARAVQAVMATGSYFSSAVTKRLLEARELPIEEELTERQTEILRLLVEGKSSKEAGFALGISSKTVDVHRSRIMDRLGLHGVASLTLYAVRRGIVRP